MTGLAFGSFLNVCITRIPRDESIVRPPSHCRSCGTSIRWRDNIPLLSWFLLLGHCRQCGARISPRYPTVELLTGMAFAASYVWFGPSGLTVKFCLFSFLVLGLIFMDAETGLLPREFTYSGIVLGLAFAWFEPGDYGGTAFLLRLYSRPVHNVHMLSLTDSVFGALAGAGFFYLAWAVYYIVRKRHGLGFGDIALMAMSGAFLGLKLVLLVVVLAPLSGVLYVIILLLWKTPDGEAQDDAAGQDAPSFLRREIPFGVFLGACSLAAVFLGERMWNWYLRMF